VDAETRDQWRAAQRVSHQSRKAGCFLPERNQNTTRSSVQRCRDRRPRAGIEEGNNTEGAGDGVSKGRAKQVAGDQNGMRRICGVENVVERIKVLTFESVCDAPIQEISAFVLRGRTGLIVVRTEISDLACALAFLNLPPWQIRVNQDVGFAQEQRGTGSDDEDGRTPMLLNFGAAFGEPDRIREILNGEAVHAAKDGIVGQIWRHEAINLSRSFPEQGGASDKGGVKCRF
jgi:hypothetical protein